MRVQTKKIKIYMTISIAKDFSCLPGARYPVESAHSGEEFRRRILYPKFCEASSRGESLEVDLDGVYCLGSSFLDEAFGGLIVNEKVPYEEVMKYLTFRATEAPVMIREIRGYLEEARGQDRRCDEGSIH
jgi:hypothetical protein